MRMGAESPEKLATWINTALLVRSDMCIALEVLGTTKPKVLSILVAHALIHSSSMVREAAVMGLVNARDMLNGILLNISENDADPQVRLTARRALEHARWEHE
jgi:hypothetical protein